MNIEARYVETLENEKVRCGLCPHRCLIDSGNGGICNTRINYHGKLYAVNYGEITSMNMDPIEKKPLYHFYPGTSILSMGSFGCNFKCSFCQNYTLSQGRAASDSFSVEEVIQMSLKAENNMGLAFTYNEPMTLYEFVYDTFKAIKEGQVPLKTVLVTNGYINLEPLRALLPYVDAMNIDIKSMDEVFYKSVCKGDLQPVLDTVAMAIEAGVHVEVTTLMVTGHVDTVSAVEPVAKYLATLNPGIPLHLSRYFPQYHMDHAATDVEAMMLVKQAALKHLKYVYLGNLFDEEANTLCPSCGEVVVERIGYRIHNRLQQKGTCPRCGEQVPYMRII